MPSFDVVVIGAGPVGENVADRVVRGGLDVEAVLRRRDGFTSHRKDDGQVAWLAEAGIPLFRGQGRISAPRTVVVTADDGSTVTLTAQHRRPRALVGRPGRRRPAQGRRHPAGGRW